MNYVEMTMPGGYKPKITKKDLEAMDDRQLFATGTTTDDAEGINMTGSGKMLRWVAVRGGAPDWAIYVHWASYGREYVASNGDKIYNKTHVKKLINADEKAMEVYRF